MYKKIVLLFIVCSLHAQTTGKISGVVYDSNQSPLTGATVSIEGTSNGTFTDDQGFYYIINLYPGAYTLKFNMIGFKTVTVNEVIISVNKTTRIDVDMDQTVIDGQEVIVTASKISTKKDQSGTIKNISEKQIEILPIKDVASIVSMQAGIVDGHFRGGRNTEVTYLIDGIRTDDAYGGVSQSVYLEPSVLRDLEVITGTFNAEYGRAMSGVVNQVTKDGGNKLERSISTQYENYLSSNEHIFPGIDNPMMNLNQDYNLQISGPIIKDKISFFLNYRYQDNLGHLNGYDFFNVDDYSNFTADNPKNYYSEHSGSHVIEPYCSNSQGGEIYHPDTGEHILEHSTCSQYGDCEIIFGGCYDNNGNFVTPNTDNYDCSHAQGTIFQTDSYIIKTNNQDMITQDICSDYTQMETLLGSQQSISIYESENFITTRFIPAQIRSEKMGNMPMNNSISSSLLGKITIRPKQNLRISLMNSSNEYEGHWYNHFYKYSPDSRSTNYSKNNFSSFFINYMLSTSAFIDLKLSHNKKNDGAYVYNNPNDNRYISDGYSRSGSGFLQGGHDKVHNTKISTDWNIKFDFNWQVNAIHNLKLGGDKLTHDLSIRNYTIRDSSATDNIYTPYIFKGVRSSYSEEYDVTCYEYAAYIQDKMEFNEMVINFGMRYDMFNPNTYYPSDYRNPGNDLINVNQSELIETKSKYQVSPRFALSYQIYGALLRFSYGHFFQMPPLYAMYSNANWLISPNSYQTILGNPNLEAEKTINYELGYWQEINNNMSYEIVLFNKDIYNLLTTKTITTYNTIKYGLYTNKDYGNARGLEFTFDYQKGPLSMVANYTFQYTKGIADSPTTSFSREGSNQDPITRLIPLSWDQRHTFNVTFGYNKENYGITLSAYFNSGTAFTFEPISENALANINLLPNNAYKPANYTVNLSSYFNLLPDIKKPKLRLTFEIYNLFDTLNEYGINSQTGRAYSAILSDSDIASFKNNYTNIEDTFQDPSQFGAPRSIKVGIEMRY
ncbi:MAG: hypothetical protein CMG66_04975 [Candidatus Marinimicrobia bacterium]|nr:hypothetical protein [Candidatus Neomarinimicrobiota bacterium]|tara:strand:- start:13887 stop:16904 length:3018 start_codon:yes stop_codon:yes gene_type:complete